MEENTDKVAEVVAVPEVKTEEVQLTGLKRYLADQRIKKIKKTALRREKQFNAMMKNWSEKTQRQEKRLKSELKRLRYLVGDDGFEQLKKICTIDVPEQKDEKGEVIQEATTHINKEALLTESKNLAILLREQRIKKGLRKRTTGRSGSRKTHADMVTFLSDRAAQAIALDTAEKNK